MTTPKRGRPKKVVADEYVIDITLSDKVFKGSGKTALEALQSISKPDKITTKGIFKISLGKLSKELLMMPPRMKRVFYPAAQPVLIKWLSAGLK